MEVTATCDVPASRRLVPYKCTKINLTCCIRLIYQAGQWCRRNYPSSTLVSPLLPPHSPLHSHKRMLFSQATVAYPSLNREAGLFVCFFFHLLWSEPSCTEDYFKIFKIFVFVLEIINLVFWRTALAQDLRLRLLFPAKLKGLDFFSRGEWKQFGWGVSDAMNKYHNVQMV